MPATEVDHLFVFSAVNAPEGEELVAAGFTEGTSNVHSGQGTACRRFFFTNGMLELIYVTDIEVTKTGSAAPTGLADRWLNQRSGASPFGLCFRPVSRGISPVAGDDESSPFPSWTYGPKYLPGGVPAYEISQRCRVIEEPFTFFTPRFSRPDIYPPERAQPLVHANGVQAISMIRLDCPQETLPDLQSRDMPANLLIHSAPKHRLYVEFDGARQGRALMLKTLPLTLLW